ncbi:MAG TPA: hypothetical protein VF194_19625 [Ferrovibrio sp.]|uniref:hypothetical protein n=1 Tax=Ferrovibrio sp. TaxID=1917215 RepID=UPI002ED39ECD
MSKKIIGHAKCPICKSGPHPVKVSDSGYLYMVCPPPADGGCQSQIFPRSAHSNRLLAQSITKWSIPKEERSEWLGDQPSPDSEEVQGELEEAIEEEEIEVEPAPEPPTPRPQQRSASRPAPKSQPARKPPQRKPTAKKEDGVKMPWEW